MVEILKTLTCLIWLTLAIIVFIRGIQWNKKFSELYDELKDATKGDVNND